ncbi:MAG: metallophosphatase [Bacteroidetes bacterium 47-18]|nr:MAG: metallophosphatase [Bacteroidetes bacterium 47-18]
MNRRYFLTKGVLAGGLLATGGFPYSALAQQQRERLVILHTNDTHSRLDPFPDTDKSFAGRGGVAARKAIIDAVRAQERNVLLLDAGDIFQGTPYFNLYKGEPEIKAMSMMGYDCATMGNHDFDIGLDGFLKQLPHATFPFVTSNYDFSRTILHKKTLPYTIIRKGGIRIGILGLGVQLYGLVPAEAYGKTYYKDPLATALEVSSHLRHKKGCDFIICLSHLGYRYDFDKVSDIRIAEQTEEIDLIIGGHTHTFLEAPVVIKNRKQRDVVINQVGWGGVNLGHLVFEFEKNKTKNSLKQYTVIPAKQTRG